MSDIDGIIVGIDIGASKTAVVVTQKDELEDKILVLGIGYATNTGIRRGKVVNLEQTIQSIKKAAEEASLMAGAQFGSVNINIPGEIDSLNSKGIVAISSKDREVRLRDIQRVLEQARILDIPHDRVILHLFPQHFKLDDQDNIKDPTGMTGIRLESHVHLITTQKMNITNIVRCVTKAGFQPQQGMAGCYAAANAVLSDDDKYSGTLLLDIGAGSTNLMAYLEGYPVFSYTLPLGGSNMSKDLSIGLKVSESLAENIKKRYGCVYSGLVDPLEEIEVPLYGKEHVERISKQKINAILEPRCEEIFMLVKKKLEERNISLDYFNNGCLITGGASKLLGMTQLADKVLGIPSRIGFSQNVTGIVDEVQDPSFAAAIGLCMGEKNFFQEESSQAKNSLISNKSGGGLKKLGNFFKEIFG